MPFSNEISVSIDNHEFKKVMDAIKGLEDQLPQLIRLSKEERNSLRTIGEKTIPFVTKALEYAETNPNFVSPLVDLEEMKRDVDLIAVLSKVREKLDKINVKIDDTIELASSEAYVPALAIFNILEGIKTK